MKYLGLGFVGLTSILSAKVSAQGACVNSPSNRQCWGDFDINTDYYSNTPDTGRTVEYWLTVDNVTLAPDGIPRQMMVFNNSFPGPLLEANWGDNVVVHVTNNLQNNGTSVHWHGVIQEHNGANDGVPGVTQCPIPPGGSFTYRWRATRYGPTWYHSHFTLQYSDGLLGPFQIYGPTVENWDIDLGTVLVQDYYRTPAFEIWFQERATPPLAADSGLINGKNQNGSIGAYSEFNFTPGKKYRMRIINTSTDNHFQFSIDGHTMTVQAADFIAVQPYNQTILSIGIGQRYDVIFEANQQVGNYWMRTVPAADCSANLNSDGIRAIVRYDGADVTANPQSTAFVATTTACVDEKGLVPVVPRDVATIGGGEEMDIGVVTSDYIKFTVNGSSLEIDWDNPTLLLADNLDDSFPGTYNVISLNGTSTTWTYFVVQSVGTTILPHPIHMHGHDFLLLAEGLGDFDASVLSSANLKNPMRRDVVVMPAPPSGSNITGAYIVIAFQLDNPGCWLLHCHIAWHVSAGLGMQFVENIDEIPGNVGVTSDWETNCQAWNSYQNAAKPAEDDSGL